MDKRIIEAINDDGKQQLVDALRDADNIDYAEVVRAAADAMAAECLHYIYNDLGRDAAEAAGLTVAALGEDQSILRAVTTDGAKVVYATHDAIGQYWTEVWSQDTDPGPDSAAVYIVEDYGVYGADVPWWDMPALLESWGIPWDRGTIVRRAGPGQSDPDDYYVLEVPSYYEGTYGAPRPRIVTDEDGDPLGFRSYAEAAAAALAMQPGADYVLAHGEAAPPDYVVVVY